MSPVDPSQLDAIREAATKRFGEQTMFHGNEIPAALALPFDSIELNLATFGGARMGRMMHLWGGPSSGKTMAAWSIARSAQNFRSEQFPDGMTVCYYNVEGTYDSDFTAELGVDVDNVEVVNCGIIEDIGRHLDVLLPAAHIHIIDSTSFAEAALYAKAKKDDSRPGADARAWQMVLKEAEQVMDKGEPEIVRKGKVVQPRREAENMIILISHETIDFNSGARKPVASKTIGHASAMTLRFAQAKKLYRTTPGGPLSDTRPQKPNDELSGGHRVNGVEVEIEVVKSKVCKPFGKARRILDYDTITFDTMFEMFKAGLFLKVINKSGSFYTIDGVEGSIQGQEKVKEALAADQSLQMKIYAAADSYCRNGGFV